MPFMGHRTRASRRNAPARLREFVFFVLVLVVLGALFLAAWGGWPLLLYAAVVWLVPLSLGVGVVATIAVLHVIANVVWRR